MFHCVPCYTISSNKFRHWLHRKSYIAETLSYLDPNIDFHHRHFAYHNLWSDPDISHPKTYQNIQKHIKTYQRLAVSTVWPQKKKFQQQLRPVQLQKGCAPVAGEGDRSLRRHGGDLHHQTRRLDCSNLKINIDQPLPDYEQCSMMTNPWFQLLPVFPGQYLIGGAMALYLTSRALNLDLSNWMRSCGKWSIDRWFTYSTCCFVFVLHRQVTDKSPEGTLHHFG